MSAPELREAVRAVLEELDEDVRASVVDTLIGRANKASSGWRPARPSQRIVEDAQSFENAARHIGHADPDDVTEHLRRATKAFLSGDHASARAVFETILPPIASADIDLGQHELVEEVLGVDARACVAQYVASVYTTFSLRNRADTMLRALEQVGGVGTRLSPIKDMEDVSAGVLSDLAAFRPLWAPLTVPPVEGRVGGRARAMAARSPLSCGRRRRSRADRAKDEAASGMPLSSLAGPIWPGGWKPRGAPLPR